jgi:hypothetical protein
MHRSRVRRRNALRAAVVALAVAAIATTDRAGDAQVAGPSVAIQPTCVDANVESFLSIEVTGFSAAAATITIESSEGVFRPQPDTIEANAPSPTVVEATIPPLPAAEYDVRVRSATTGEFELTAEATLAVPCARPTLRLDPPLVAPGGVTQAIGEKFPPDVSVALRWRGPGNAQPPMLWSCCAQTSATGGLRATLLIPRRDIIGGRELVAYDPATGTEIAKASMLVVAGTVQPSTFALRR